MNDIVFNFLIDSTNNELESYKRVTDFTKHGMERAELGWCLQTYSILSRRGRVQVKCSNHLQEQVINIVHSAQLLKLKGSPAHFIVCVQADFPRRNWAHYHIVQNKRQVGKHSSFVPHWILPVIKRDAARNEVKRVAFAGLNFNGNLAATEESWKRYFKPYNIEFSALSAGQWHDLSTVDVLIGIRSFDSNPHNNKPAAKLFNAWHAGIPFIGGSDSAYRQVGSPGGDYLVARSPSEVVNAVLKLRDDKEFYAEMVGKGFQKAKEYTNEITAEIWEDILTGPVIERHRIWMRQRAYEHIKFVAALKFSLVAYNVKQVVKNVKNRVPK